MHRSRPPIGRALRQCGFTLVEMVTVFAIVAIGAMIAMPSLRDALVNQRVRAAATDLTSSLLLARSEAIKRSDQVQIAPSAGNDWTSGWRVVGVTAGDQIDRKDTLGDGVQVARAPDTIVYQRNGRLTAPGLVRLQIADATSAVRTRCITIDPSGLPRLATGVCP